MSHSVVKLYVKSVKTVTGSIDFERLYTRRSRLPPTIEKKPIRKLMLPEDQERTVAIVKNIASKYGLDVEVVDMARRNVLQRVLEERKARIKTFPTILASPEGRLEGNITEDQVTSLLYKISEKTRKKYI